MGKHNPNAKTFLQTMERYEKTLEHFLASSDFQETLIAHANHTWAWHYTYQTLKVRLLPGDTWEVNPASSWSNGNDCIVTLHQINDHFRYMEKIGESRSFEDILHADPEDARRVLEKLYTNQEAEIKQSIRSRFTSMRQGGRMD